MNRSDITKEIARREALGAAWAASAKTLRADLERQALEQYAQNTGEGVTWTYRDLGRVTLPLSTEATYIADIDALLKWVKERHPENVETVEQVRAAFQKWLLENAQITEDGTVIDPETAEVIPGMGVREGGKPKALTITVERPVKELLANYAAAEVERALVAEYGAEPDAGVPEICCLGCGLLIHDGEPIEMIGDGYAHAECPEAVAE